MTIRTDNDGLLAQRDRHGNLISVKGPGPASPDRRAFTLVETLMVVAILIIAALVAIPLTSSAGGVAVQAAADRVAADLEYAKSMAVTRGQSYSVAFNINTETYSVKDQGGTVLGHPIKGGSDYAVNFAQDSRFAGVEIESVDFDSTSEIKFDYLGSPQAADGDDLVDRGEIILSYGSVTRAVFIEPVTGVITTDN